MGVADHDYGCNNADRTYKFRRESGMLYVNDFLGEPAESAMSRRARAGHGVYGVKLFDFARPKEQYEVHEWEAGIDPDAVVGSALPVVPPFSNETVAVFVLDVRSNKSPWKKGSAAYLPDYEGDFLGERQWKWFEQAIRRSQASVNVVVNGLQVHANRFPDGNIAEAWSKYPRAQQRLFDILLQPGVSSPVLISGDVHMSQIMRKDCVRRGEHDSLPRPLLELTTSGMTHSWGSLTSPPLAHPTKRPSWREVYESLVAGTMVRLLHYTCPWTDLLHGGDAEGSGTLGTGLQFSLQKNFGELEFDWGERTVALRAFGENSRAGAPPLLQAEFSMDQLSGSAPILNDHLRRQDFQYEERNHLPESEWICLNHRGRENKMSHMLGHLYTAVGLAFLVPFPFALPGLAILILGRLAKAKRVQSHPLYR